MAYQRIRFRVHALRRMFRRHISADDVHRVLATGQVIEEYPEDLPYPSRLILGWCRNRPIHVVAAYNASENETIIITAYEPDPQRWDRELKRRRS